MHKAVKRGKLVLQDGSVYEGRLCGKRTAAGEVVFTTGMSGYQETLTDPSFCGQIVVMTYPLVGNYGVNSMFNQSGRSYFSGYVVGELCDTPSNWRSEGTLESFLEKMDIPVLMGVDTRAVTRKIRELGVLKGVIVPAEMSREETDTLLERAEMRDQIARVSTKEMYIVGAGKYNVAVLDLGVKNSILKNLLNFDCRLTVFPAATSAETILRSNPDGIFLSNGPGDPKDVPEIVASVKELLGKKPIFGICMGHQITALANGADTYKMKFGHRGVNQPVKDLASGRVYITAQNHGYAVAEASIADKPVKITHLSVNDGTIEGLEYLEHPTFTVQYHPEASPGPGGHDYLFRHFIDLMEGR